MAPGNPEAAPSGSKSIWHEAADLTIRIQAFRSRAGQSAGLHAEPSNATPSADSGQASPPLAEKPARTQPPLGRTQPKQRQNQKKLPSKCIRHIKDLWKVYKKKVDRDVFVTRDMMPKLSLKERYSNSSIHILPETAEAAMQPFNFDRCAVVGNSGHLKLTRYGTAIDLFDVVLRTNQAPTKGYAKHVGTKTTIRLINRSIANTYVRAIASHIRKLRSSAKAKAGDSGPHTLQKFDANGTDGRPRRRLAQTDGERGEATRMDLEPQQDVMNYPIETNVTMVLLTEARGRTSETRNFHRAMHNFRPDVNILALSGKSRRASEELLLGWVARQKVCTGRDTGKRNENRGTTGLLAVATMLHLCKDVVLFGFGRPKNGTKVANYHYYSGLRSRSWSSKSSSVHNFAGEASVIRNLRNEHLLQMCTEDSPRTCGLPLWKVKELAEKHNATYVKRHGMYILPEHIPIEDAKETSDSRSLSVSNEEILEQERWEEEENRRAATDVGGEPGGDDQDNDDPDDGDNQ
eukprot:CAMPEP_0177615764 /NCGR_PEP_ID=MMETSP0419_2-20121207/23690_1 /TAXON_ID=582737 /ORGANISM="Tetraselmis sp., Strain GSL018" /LENGTH=518 /DNA_ID=CAMNT_0019113565 /DNA_START=1051 /DNA_END=2607 /DNA_ORIENTATION=-